MPEPSENESPLVIAYFRMIRAFNESDLDAVRALLHDDVVYTIPGRSPIAGTARGITEHLAQLQRARASSNNTLRLDPTDVVASAERLFVYGRITAQRGDRRDTPPPPTTPHLTPAVNGSWRRCFFHSDAGHSDRRGT